MKSFIAVPGLVAMVCAAFLFQACGKSEPGANANSGASGSASVSGDSGGINATYKSIGEDEFTIEFRSNGNVHMTSPIGEDNGTYTAEGDKIIVKLKDNTFRFIRNGNCIEDIAVFGKLCIGGKSGEATAAAATMGPTGTYVATNDVGDFSREFSAGSKVVLHASLKGEKPEIAEGTYSIVSSMIDVKLPDGERMTLMYVNDTLETNAFGFPLKFVKK